MKFSGKIGYVVTAETVPGVWNNSNVEKDAVGDWIKNMHSFQGSNDVNSDLVMVSSVSIIANPYVLQNYSFIKYVKTLDGTKWTVKSVDIQYPRLILTLGGVYNA